MKKTITLLVLLFTVFINAQNYKIINIEVFDYNESSNKFVKNDSQSMNENEKMEDNEVEFTEDSIEFMFLDVIFSINTGNPFTKENKKYSIYTTDTDLRDYISKIKVLTEEINEAHYYELMNNKIEEGNFYYIMLINNKIYQKYKVYFKK